MAESGCRPSRQQRQQPQPLRGGQYAGVPSFTRRDEPGRRGSAPVGALASPAHGRHRRSRPILGAALVGLAVGELLIRRAGGGLLSDLDRAASPGPEAANLDATLGLPYEPLAAVLGVLALAALLAPPSLRVEVRARARRAERARVGALPAAAWDRAPRAGWMVSAKHGARDRGLGSVLSVSRCT